MKKKILGGLAILVIAVVAAFNVNVSVKVQEDGLSDVSLDNVEALAYGESLATPNSWIRHYSWSGGMGGGMGTNCARGGRSYCM